MRIGSAAASVALHLAVFAWLLWLPERASAPHGVTAARTEVTLLSPEELQRALDRHADDPVLPAPEPSDVVAEPAVDSAEPPTELGASDPGGGSPPIDGAPPPSPDDAVPHPPADPVTSALDVDGPAPTSPGSGALALLERPGAPARGDAGSLAPRLAPGALGTMRPGTKPGPAEEHRFAVKPLPADATEIKTPEDAGFVRKRDGRLVFRDPDPGAQWSAQLMPDGRLQFKDHWVPHGTQRGAGSKTPGLARGNVGGGAGGPAPNLAQAILMAQGFKFWLKRKQRLLKATRALRLQMAVDFAQRNIDRRLARLVGDLAKIWASDKPPKTRRGLLFDVWDECEESLTVQLGEFTDGEVSRIDSIRSEAATKARKRIVAFIRRTLPQGSAEAYPPAELRALNRRRLSKAEFAPYAAS